MPSRRAASFAAFALACASASCAALLGFERLSADDLDGGVAEAGPDGPEEVDAGDEGGPCRELGVPGPPADAAPGDVPPVLGALRLLDFGLEVDGGRPQIPGLNLDLTCSVDVASSSCTTKLLPTTFETHAKDKSATGIDNAGFSLIEYLSRLSDVLSAKAFNEGLQAGLYGAVLRVQGWNGLPDDDAVQVEVFPAIGFERNGDGGTRPAFDEHDEWKLDSRFQVGGVLEASTIRSDRAWVTGGRAVARFKEITLLLLLSDDPKPFEVRMTDAVLSATIGTDAAGRRALRDGVVAGRWKTSDFLGQVRTIYLADSNGLVDTTLCDKVSGATLIYTGVKATICDGRDIRSDSEDNKDLPCDAVSAAARVEAYAIDKLGAFEASFDGGGRCEDPAIPLGDDCPP
ncbi:MAG: hypothetical protein KIS78_21910 [Labilithrix sp.]|nr:hypothetical protein [Labilithrix sp.]MCW5835071.1 hypothetical protein [Labilithrix sp.]